MLRPSHGSLHFRPHPQKPIDWMHATTSNAFQFAHKAVIAGKEPGRTGCPLWVIRAEHNGDLIPGKLAIDDKAYVPYGRKEVIVDEFEVLWVSPGTVHWVPASKGRVPVGAIPGGYTQKGETLYIGRVAHKDSLTPGKVHPNHGCLYISFGGAEVSYKSYEVLCESD